MRVLSAILIVASMLLGGLLASATIPRGMEWAYEALSRMPEEPAFRKPFPQQAFVQAATFVFGALIFGVLGVYAMGRTQRFIARWGVMSNADKVTLFVSILVGVGLSIPFHVLFFSFGPTAVAGSFVLMLVLVAVSVGMLRGMQDVLPWAKLGAGRQTGIKIFDTNVIIDGRVYEVAKSGFLEGKMYIPQFVIDELRLIADSHDPNRRQRGRRGLDLLKHLQGEFDVEIGTHDDLAGEPSEEVDSRLVYLAKSLGAQLVTNDFNLNKVAQVHGIPVLNLNDLAMSLRPVYLPSDLLTIDIERVGSQQGQGVGFLEDGTMVVVDQAEQYIGETVDVRVTQIHQSAAGRMIFGNLDAVENEKGPRRART